MKQGGFKSGNPVQDQFALHLFSVPVFHNTSLHSTARTEALTHHGFPDIIHPAFPWSRVIYAIIPTSQMLFSTEELFVPVLQSSQCNKTLLSCDKDIICSSSWENQTMVSAISEKQECIDQRVAFLLNRGLTQAEIASWLHMPLHTVFTLVCVMRKAQTDSMETRR